MASQAWDRRADESPQAFEAFVTFIMLGAERSTAKVGQRLGKSKKLMERWSLRHDWQLRIGAYEEHFQLKRLDSHEKERDKMLDRCKDLADRGLSIVGRWLTKVDEASDEELIELLKGWRPNDMISLLRESVHVGRLSVGLNGGEVPAREKSTDLSGLDEQDLETLEQILSKAES